MKDEVKIKCFKCRSDKLIVGFPRVVDGKPQLEINCADCGWDIMGFGVEWDTVRMLDNADKIANKLISHPKKEEGGG